MSAASSGVSRYISVRFFKYVKAYTTTFNQKQTTLFHSSPYLSIKGHEIKMPSLSPNMSEGKIVKWLKKEGDEINAGDIICNIETDRDVFSMEIEKTGILAKILVGENKENVSVGSLIGLMVNSGENWKEVEMPECVERMPDQLDRSNSGNSENKSGPSGIHIKMPSLSPTMTEGSLVKWYKKEGDAVAPGDILCDIQTDKAIISYETEEEGILAKILAPDDSKDIKVGTIIGIIVGENEDWRNVSVPETATENVCEANVPPSSSSGAAEKPDEKLGVSYGPAVRSLLSVYDIDASAVKATGRNNKLLKEDILRFIEENKLQKKPPKPVSLPLVASGISRPASPIRSEASTSTSISSSPISVPYSQDLVRKRQSRFVDIEHTNVRRVIAKRLTESKYKIPHAYGMITCQADELIKLRKEMMDLGVKVSLNDYIIKGAALALQSCPKVNVICVNDEYRHSSTIDISVAVATPNGLITPIVPDVAGKTVSEISEILKEMIPRARAGKLKPQEFQGGSFTISNLGMFGIKHFTAIINPPQCAILAVGAATDRFTSDGRTCHDIYFTLSYDRRALQEDEVAEFLQNLKTAIECPRQLVAQSISVARAYGL